MAALVRPGERAVLIGARSPRRKPAERSGPLNTAVSESSLPDQTAGTAERPLRIALLGARGIPANYGGYETFLEQLAPRLVAQGWDVTVYCRSHHTPPSLRTHLGVSLRVLPTIRTKHLDTPVHTLLSACDAMFRGFDAALVVNGINAVFVPLLRLVGTRTALHVDGIEHTRAKWGRLGTLAYRLSERLAVRLANELVSDAGVIRDHYLERYGKETTMIPYGASLEPPGEAPAGARAANRETTGSNSQPSTLEHLGLQQNGYYLYVSRFERENNPHRVVEAYALARERGVQRPLVMVGDAPYAAEFIASFRDDPPDGAIFPGAIYGDGYRELQRGAYAYVHATEVGGTHPALIEAMGVGNCVLANEVPENLEVLGDAGDYFRAAEPETLAQLFCRYDKDPGQAAEAGRRALRRAESLYSWSAVTRQYVALFEQLASSRSRTRLSR